MFSLQQISFILYAVGIKYGLPQGTRGMVNIVCGEPGDRSITALVANLNLDSEAVDFSFKQGQTTILPKYRKSKDQIQERLAIIANQRYGIQTNIKDKNRALFGFGRGSDNRSDSGGCVIDTRP